MPVSTKRPNFLIILADDLGFSDLACFGSEIKTPHLDELAANGLRMTDYCHMAGLGVMSEFRTIDPERWNVAGHEGYMNHDVASISEIFQANGYFTCMSGKWHLGWKDGFLPHNRGFDRSFVMVPGSTNHYGWEPAYDDAQNGRPKKFLPGHSLPLYTMDGHRWKPEPNTSNDPTRGFYSSSFYTDTLISLLDDQKSEAKPFFAYLPFTAPHFPLQCSKEDRDLYLGQYASGPEALRQSRLSRMKDMGLVARDVQAHPVEACTADWDEMTAHERELSARSMEIFAGMVTAIDREVGKVVAYLKDIGEYDNTVIIFQSDNGAEGAAMEANPAMGPDLLAAIDKYYDNSLENLGNHNSFCWYGPRWAQASTAPSRLYKAYNTEGGIRVPFIARYPPWHRLQAPGSVLPSFATVMDIAPTLLDLAGIPHPNSNPSHPRDMVNWHGRQIYGMRGKSWNPYLIHGTVSDDSHPAASIHGASDPPTGWEMFGRGALRKGMWKINHMNANDHGKGQWELFDLASDPGEVTDLAELMPEKVQELVKNFEVYVKQVGAIWGPPVDMEGPRSKLPEDMIGGDPIEDQRAWMHIGVGKRFTQGIESLEP